MESRSRSYEGITNGVKNNSQGIECIFTKPMVMLNGKDWLVHKQRNMRDNLHQMLGPQFSPFYLYVAIISHGSLVTQL